MTKPTAFPTIHINGSNKTSLMMEYIEAVNAVSDAINKFHKIDFNGRDYYVQSDAAWRAAQAERAEHFRNLTKVHTYLSEIAVNISNQ